MDYLVDTHAFLWFVSGDSQLSLDVKEILENQKLTKYISMASIWEIAIKINIGKLKLDVEFNELRSIINNCGFQILPIGFYDIEELTKLELIHRDPFDRILISQAISEDLTILTKDENIRKYNIKYIW